MDKQNPKRKERKDYVTIYYTVVYKIAFLGSPHSLELAVQRVVGDSLWFRRKSKGKNHFARCRRWQMSPDLESGIKFYPREAAVPSIPLQAQPQFPQAIALQPPQPALRSIGETWCSASSRAAHKLSHQSATRALISTRKSTAGNPAAQHFSFAGNILLGCPSLW